MQSDKTLLWIFLIGIVLVLALGAMIQKNYSPFSIFGTETMTRTGPTSVNPGATFNIVYTAIGTSGNFGATIEDLVSGGCQLPAGTQLKTVMLSDEGTIKTIQVTAPASGSCTFTGDYQYGNTSIKTFNDLIVTISNTTNATCTPSWTSGTWSVCTLTESCTFKLGTFCVKLWMIILVGAGIFVVIMIRRKK